jgi:hypothetical protein
MAISIKDEMMLPSEMEIMLAIALNKSVGKRLANSSMDVITEYFVNLFNSLVSRGCLKGNRVKGYQLTPIGRTTLMKLLQKNEARTQNTLRMLRILGIDYCNGMDILRQNEFPSIKKGKHSLAALFTK